MRHAVAALLVCTSLAACAGQDSATVAASADSALSRDIALASGGAPQNGVLGDTALTVPTVDPAAGPESAPTPAASPVSRPTPTPRPRAEPAPAPTPPEPSPVPSPAAPPPTEPPPAPAAAPEPAPAKAARALGAGTALEATTSTRICARTNRAGDKLVATLKEPITASDGSTIPAGVPVVFEVAEQSANGEITLRARAISVNGTSVPIDGTASTEGATETQRVASGDDKGKVVRGAIIGAIAGRILGGSTRGAVIGAAGGAAVGTVQAMKGGGSERCLAPGATVRVTLASAATLP
ncbi:MAG: hypothetical protein MUF00_08825 [Gemmatimonadaceae bacterium]|jgi:hypothetical protein|nr:hypothetical protein [Gemmatimonadaceae bacterium]